MRMVPLTVCAVAGAALSMFVTVSGTGKPIAGNAHLELIRVPVPHGATRRAFGHRPTHGWLLGHADGARVPV